MDLESYLLEDRKIPFEDAASFSVLLRGINKRGGTSLEFTKEAKLGTLKLMLAKHAQGENAEEIQDAVMLDPQVQKALDFQAAQAQAQNATAQLVQMQQQMEGMQQGMQQLQQQAEQAGQQLQMTQQENSQLQEQLQGEMQMRQQSNMQAMQAQDQAINTKAMAQKQRHELSQMADQMSLQLKQVAAQDPEQAQMQQEQAMAQQQAMEQEQAKAALPPKQRKEMEEAEKAQQHAQVQGQQAEQAQAQVQGQQAGQGPMQQAMQQQAAAQQQQAAAQQAPQAAPQEGGMVAQSSAGMSKMDILRYKLKEAAGIRDAYDAGKTMGVLRSKGGRVGKWLGTHGSKDLKEVGMSLPERMAFRTGEHRDKYLLGAGIAGAGATGVLVGAKVRGKKEKSSFIPDMNSGDGNFDFDPPQMKQAACKVKNSELGKCAKCGTKVKHSEMEKHTCGRMKLAANLSPEQHSELMKSVDDYEKPLLNRVFGAGRYGKAYRIHFNRMAGNKPTPEDEEYLSRYNPSGSIGRDAEQQAQQLIGKKKEGMVPPPTSALKARLIEAGIGAGLGAMTGAAYEAGRQRFSHTPPTAPSPEEIDLEKRNRAAQIKAKESPTLINRIAATKTMAELDAERDMRMNPNKAILRRALQGAIVGGSAAPLVMAAKQNLTPRIMG